MKKLVFLSLSVFSVVSCSGNDQGSSVQGLPSDQSATQANDRFEIYEQKKVEFCQSVRSSLPKSFKTGEYSRCNKGCLVPVDAIEETTFLTELTELFTKKVIISAYDQAPAENEADFVVKVEFVLNLPEKPVCTSAMGLKVNDQSVDLLLMREASREASGLD